MQTLAPFVWYDGTAEPAAELYESVFPDAEIAQTMRHLDDTVGNAGDVLLIKMRIGGQELFLLNGGPQYAAPGNVSLYYKCKDQAEIDRCWEMLAEGGETMACGWLQDRFGIVWQIQPAELDSMLASEDKDQVLRVFKSVWGMEKIDLAAIRDAYSGD